MELNEWGYLSKAEQNRVLHRLNSPFDVVTDDDRFSLSKDLLNLNEFTRKNIVEISALLNKGKDDSFYIPYSLLSSYLEYQISNVEPDMGMSLLEKNYELATTRKLLKDNINNSEFVNIIYQKVRTGAQNNIVFKHCRMKDILENKDGNKEEITASSVAAFRKCYYR